MKINANELRRQIGRAGSRGWAPIMNQAERRHKLPAGLLIAIASRETDMNDIVGDNGHGRGLFQIDDRAHTDWLSQHGAKGAGTKPSVADAAEFAAALLASNRSFGQRNGIARKDLLKFACSAYNAGAGGALAGHQAGDSDARTTGRDYGRDVLERLAAIKGGNGGAPQPSGDGILRKGAREAKVTRLKRDLQKWFEQNAPGVWETFGVAQGPAFGASLDRAVRDFQERNGLTIDGEVGEETLGALSGRVSRAPARPPAPKLADLRLDLPKKRGSKGGRVKLVQAWLCLHDFKVVVDGDFGAATASQVRKFQAKRKLPVTGVVDEATYNELIKPMVAALSPLSGRRALGPLVVAYARQHLKQHPLEVGGQNTGPWVRLYTDGLEGPAFPWCAGFATFCLKQASDSREHPPPIGRTLACDEMARQAGDRLLRQPKPSQRKRIKPGSFFLKLATHGEPFKYAHTGIVVRADAETFASIEGNTNDEGSAEGFEVCARTRGYTGMDFILI
jgi:peptidoglycan hydrolase-like protein with peptidoglycan-binding domain